MSKKAVKLSKADAILSGLQYLLPQHSLSLIMYRVARCRVRWFKNGFIRLIIAKYGVNLAEAIDTDLAAYPHFNAFFTRQLRPGVRPVAPGSDVIVSPVDGMISQQGRIEDGTLVQAKGRHYKIQALLGGDKGLAQTFEQGQFMTIYLSPKDYHRIHMPLTGILTRMRYIPGQLFSVNPRTARSVDHLFARNERVVTVFDTKQGPMVLVLVGAIFVGSMETVWSGQVTPPYGHEIQDWYYPPQESVTLQKGEEMGRFNMGSTVIVLLTEHAKALDPRYCAGQTVKMGECLTPPD